MSFLTPEHKNKSSIANHIATIAIVLASYVLLGQIPLFIALVKASSNSTNILRVLQETYGLNVTFVLVLMPLVVTFFGLIFALKFIHKWEVRKVFTARKKFDFKRLIFGFLLWFGISILILWIGFNDKVEWNFNFEKFAPLFLLSFLLIPLQSAAEELFFRGYLIQWVGERNRKPWHEIIITGTIFGLLHISNPEIGELGEIALIYYVWTGFFLAILTILDDGLELPIGYHIANNLFAALIVTTDWQAFQTDALFIDKNLPEFSLEMMAYLLAGQAIFVFTFYKIYKWKVAKRANLY